jgi:hypothetical protein
MVEFGMNPLRFLEKSQEKVRSENQEISQPTTYFEVW